MDTLQTLRSSGRTTRMLGDAITLARSRRAVYIVASDRNELDILWRRLHQLVGDELSVLGIKMELLSSLNNLDWITMRLRGAHPNAIVLVDHYVIEKKFQAILEMLHRYDPITTKEGEWK